jgi:broad specificity phosphatase PhoE
MTTLLLARHASHAVVHGVLVGRDPDVRLSAAGRAEAAWLARRVARERPVAVYTSPQPRCRETAAAIAETCHLVPEVCEAIDEIDFGTWRGRSFAELDADPRWAVWNGSRGTARPPGGEAMHEAQSRVLRWTGTLAERHGEAVVIAVSHADVIKAMVMAHLGLHLDAHHRFGIAPASLSALTLWPGGGRVLFLNETGAGEGA